MKKLSLSPLYIFLSLHMFFWTIVPYICRRALPMDSIEAIVWGSFWELGTNKHPPFSAFIAYPFYKMTMESEWSVYLLSQLCILVGFIYIYKLAKCFFSKEKAMFATMMLEGTIYYTITSPEYNVNVVSLALWPMNVYYFYKSITDDKYKDWSIFGVISALNVLNKYTSGMLFVPMLAYMLCTAEGRKILKKKGLYIAVCIASLLCLPHVMWLWKYDFYTLDYFMGRSVGKSYQILEEYPYLSHMLYPLKFSANLMLAGLGTILLYAFAFGKAKKEPFKIKNKSFVLFMGVGPAAFCVLISMVGGVYLKSMWGTPCLYMLTIVLFALFPRLLLKPMRIIKSIYIVMFIMLSVAAGIYLGSASEKVYLDSKMFAEYVQNVWKDKYPERPWAYVGGDIWLAANAALYSDERPLVVAVSPENNPWLSREDIIEKGAAILTFHPSDCALFDKDTYVYKKFPLKVENYFGKTKEKEVYYCLMKE